jgi:hypothetical protein
VRHSPGGNCFEGSDEVGKSLDPRSTQAKTKAEAPACLVSNKRASHDRLIVVVTAASVLLDSGSSSGDGE